mgnify:CR=1 FL=1
MFGASCVAARFTRLPLVLIVGARATIWVCLGRAVSIYSATHTMHWPHSPPISGLAESAEGFVWFSTGFMSLREGQGLFWLGGGKASLWLGRGGVDSGGGAVSGEGG